MKSHVVRAMQTDRYGFTVPTKASELEPDTSSARIAGESGILLSAPSDGPNDFVMGGTTITQRVGFAEPSGDLDIVIPETGLYAISCVFTWASTTTSGGGVGRITTPGTYTLQTVFAGSVQAVLDGSYLRDNKLGPLTTNPGDVPVSVAVSLVVALTAGDVISPNAEAVAAADDLTARINFLVARIA